MLHGLEAYMAGCRRQEPTSRQRVLSPFKLDERERERVLGCLSTDTKVPYVCYSYVARRKGVIVIIHLYLKCQDIYRLCMGCGRVAHFERIHRIARVEDQETH
jgi:hypothetical protein